MRGMTNIKELRKHQEMTNSSLGASRNHQRGSHISPEYYRMSGDFLSKSLDWKTSHKKKRAHACFREMNELI